MIERTYVIPLRRGWLKAPRYRRAKKAINTAKEFLVQHMKSEDVRLGTFLNLEIWKHGMRNPPSRVKVNVSKDDKGVVFAELFGAPTKKVEAPKKAKKAVAKPVEVVKSAPEVKVESAEKPKTAPVKKVPKSEVKAE